MILGLLLANSVVALCYYAIAGLVGIQLLRAHERGANPLGIATAGIFFTCALGHSVHVLAFLLTLIAPAQKLASTGGAVGVVRWLCDLGLGPVALDPSFTHAVSTPAIAQLVVDSLTVVPAIGFLALRRRYGLLVDGESVILDYERTLAVERARVQERTEALVSAQEHARELAKARSAAERAYEAALRATEALRASESFLRTVVEAAPVGIATLGEHGVIQTANPALCRLLENEQQRLVGQPFRALVLPDDHSRLAGWTTELLAEPTQTRRAELRLLREGAEPFWTAVIVTTIRDPEGASTAGLIIVEDITERRAMEDERLRIERGLLEAQRLESLGVLAGGIAHDFNNILTSILGHAELAALDLPQEHPTQAGLIQVREGSLRAAELVHQMLAYAGKGAFQIAAVQLSELVCEMAELVHVSLGKHAQLVMKLAPDLPRVAVDVVQMRQVLLNLITNGAEAIDRAGGTVTITTAVQELGREALDRLVFGRELQPGPYVTLVVADTGQGMEPAVLRRIFDPFYTTKFTGRGLGLSAVQGIVRAHRGALLVESAPGAGTTFRIWLPVATTVPPARVPVVGRAARGGALLLIDDEDPVREVLARMLENLGYTVVLAADGAAGLAIARAGVLELRAVITDLTMPGMSGIELAEQLIAILPGTPVVLMSGYSATELAERQLPANVLGLLQKPFTLDRVRDLLGLLEDRSG